MKGQEQRTLRPCIAPQFPTNSSLFFQPSLLSPSLFMFAFFLPLRLLFHVVSRLSGSACLCHFLSLL